jgi:hypothetical protein
LTISLFPGFIAQLLQNNLLFEEKVFNVLAKNYHSLITCIIESGFKKNLLLPDADGLGNFAGLDGVVPSEFCVPVRHFLLPPPRPFPFERESFADGPGRIAPKALVHQHRQ